MCGLGQRVEILDEGARGSVNPRNLRIGGIDQIVLIRSMGTRPVPCSKMSGGKIERFGSEDVSRPGTGGSRPQHRIQAQLAVQGGLGMAKFSGAEARSRSRGLITGWLTDTSCA